MGYKMRVIISGSNNDQINKIAIVTFLEGLHSLYKDDLYVIYTGDGRVSAIVEEWVDKTWPGFSARNCFNAEWSIADWASIDGYEGAGYRLVEETKPDLIFLFGHNEYKMHYPARNFDIPLYVLEKNE